MKPYISKFSEEETTRHPDFSAATKAFIANISKNGASAEDAARLAGTEMGWLLSDIIKNSVPDEEQQKIFFENLKKNLG